jgi:hypothetical protein
MWLCRHGWLLNMSCAQPHLPVCASWAFSYLFTVSARLRGRAGTRWHGPSYQRLHRTIRCLSPSTCIMRRPALGCQVLTVVLTGTVRSSAVMHCPAYAGFGTSFLLSVVRSLYVITSTDHWASVPRVVQWMAGGITSWQAIWIPSIMKSKHAAML